MPFMPAVSLNQWSGALPKRGICFPAKVFLSDSLPPPLSVFACSAIQSFGFRQRLLSERELALMVLGLSFYPLEQAPNIVIYAMSKFRGQQRAV
jgi:hypothetical protein